MPLNNINWRPGAISPYESIWSIRKKFSILNRVNGKNFDTGISELLAKKKIISLEDIDVIARTKIVSSFLGDHKYNFKNIFIDDYILPRVVVNSRQKLNTVLRYCPQCLAAGFHSPIHQINWVENCPIHLRSLETLDDSRNSLYEWSCRRKLQRQSIFIYENSNYVGQLEEIESYWIWGSRSKWPDPFTSQDLYRVRDYLIWMKKLANAAEVWNSSAAWNALQKNLCTTEESNVLLSIWREIVPPPPSVEEILQRPVKVSEIQKTIFSKTHIATSIDETIRNYGYKTLEYGLSWSDRMVKRKNILISVVKRATSILIGQNIRCLKKHYRIKKFSTGLNNFNTHGKFGDCFYHDALLILGDIHKCLLDGMLPGWILGDWDISQTIGNDLNIYLHNNDLINNSVSNSDLSKCGDWRHEIRFIIELFSLYSLMIYIHKKIEGIFPLFQKLDYFSVILGNPYVLVKRDGNKLNIKIFTDSRLLVSMKNIFGGGSRKIRKSSECDRCFQSGNPYRFIDFK